MKHAADAAPDGMPSFRAVPFLSADARALTDRQREALTRIGTAVRPKARGLLYAGGAPAEAIFAVVAGVLKSYRDLPSGKRVVSTFLFPGDLCGLARRGRYVNTVRAITPSTLCRLPVAALTALLKQDSDLQYQFLVKVTHELRESQRRAVLMNRRDAAGRLATFLALMAEHQEPAAGRAIHVPMTRSDIADFLGLSLESVSRATAELKARRLARFETRHRVRILDEAGLARLIGDV